MRNDQATGYKLSLYWNKSPIRKEENEKYLLKEIERLGSDLELEKAKHGALSAEFEKEIEITRAMLAVQEAKLKKVTNYVHT